MSQISQNLESVWEKINKAAPDPSRVTLVAVSKTKPVEMILDAHQAGQVIFGENKVQEARDKKNLIPPEIDLHLIGPLQTNKAKYCPDLFSTIHSLSRIEVAEMLQKKCLEKGGKILNVFIQMNLEQETTKAGLESYEALQQFAEKIMAFSQLRLLGLMTIPSVNAGEKETREIYRQLYEMNQKEATRLDIPHQMKELSMGMSHDFEWALQEGATYIRVGTAIFGTRDKK